MANNKTLLKAMERCEKRIARAKNKRQWSKSILDRDKAQEMIEENESKIIRLRQQIQFNIAMKERK